MPMRWLLVILFAGGLASAEPLARQAVPEPLRPWTGWALHGREGELECPLPHDGGARVCIWPGRLELQLDGSGGRFAQRAVASREGWLTLPGGEDAWPQEVKLDGKPAVVTDADGTPRLKLPAGEHAITGRFLWNALPESLDIAPETALLALSLRGRPVPFPVRGEAGRLFLQAEAAPEAETERLELRVHRKVTDDVPLQLETQIELDVSGKGRELLLGRALPDGFVPLSMASELPARLEPDGKLRLQAHAGRFTVTLVARHEGPVQSLARPPTGGTWADGEVWVFEARPKLRQVVVEGVPALDASQTTLPDEWRQLPTYGLGANDVMTLTERSRGNADPEPDLLQLHRELWLDFDGNGYSVQDSLGGQLRRSTRLDLRNPAQLGRVVSGGSDQLITRAGEGRPAGVELRDGEISIEADSRIEGPLRRLPAVGWDADFQSVGAVLHLPPGWRLLHASGADDVPGTWVRRWTLLEIFLVVVTALAALKLHGRAAGLLALVTLVMLFPESNAPRYGWLVLLVFEALGRVIPQPRLREAATLLRHGAWIVVLLAGLAFAVDHLREALFPALARPGVQLGTLAGHDAYVTESDAIYSRSLSKQQAFSESPAGIEDSEGGSGGGTRKLFAASSNALARKVAESAAAPQAPAAAVQLRAQAYDKDAQIQTGPGRPRWDWESVRIGFSGPVQRDQELSLLLLSPGMNLFLALFRVLLLAALLFVTLGLSRDRWTRLLRAGAATAAIALMAVGWPSEARAEESPAEVVAVAPLLDTLRDRLLEAPDCAPGCAALPRMNLDVKGDLLSLRLELHAQVLVSVPLPGNAGQWLPDNVLVDGKPAAALRRADDGVLWLALAPGAHDVVLTGRLPERETVSLALPLSPRRVDARLDGWRLDGLRDDGRVDEGLQLTREQREAGRTSAALETGNLPPFLRVERTLQLGLKWTLFTRVSRLTPTGTPVVVEIPLIPGESVTSSELRVQNGKAVVSLAPAATETSWSSGLAVASSLVLTAAPGPFAETWRLEASPVWNVTPSGLAPIHPEAASDRAPVWRPWPGETVTLAIARPAPVAGQTLTIDQGSLRVSPGTRATDTTWTLHLRSSRGGLHPVTLPEGAQLQSVKVNDVLQPVRQEGRTVALPVTPGAQSFELVFRESSGITASWQTPRVDAGLPVVNAGLEASLPRDRWVLFVSGPSMGPAVLFWSYLLVLVAVALMLGRSGLAPLPAIQWMLLLVGLSQLPLAAAAFVVAWLLALAWRGRTPSMGQHRYLFPLRQLMLAGWTFVALLLLAWAIQHGLLGQPEMQVSGNGSSAHLLRWFSDRAASAWPEARVYSVPMLVYRLAMLAWSLWLARALLAWLKWGWEAFGKGGFWTESTLERVPEPRPETKPEGTPG